MGFFPIFLSQLRQISEGLAAAVHSLDASVGFAQDPDADRLAIVDEQGRFIGEEYTLVLAAMSLLEARAALGEPTDGVIVVNLSTSRMIEDRRRELRGARRAHAGRRGERGQRDVPTQCRG